MQNLNKLNSFSFRLVAILVIITAGLSLAVSIPTIKSWQTKQIDKLLSRSTNIQNPTEKQNLLKQASLLGLDDPVATEALADSYWKMGEYGGTIATYQTSWTQVNYLYLATLALKSDQPKLAKAYFGQVDRAGESAESQAGLAKVAFINKQVAEGCNHADRAKKLNLSSEPAIQAGLLCDAMMSTTANNNRAQAYLFLNNYIYEAGLTKLEAIENKTDNDWLVLAKVYASKGDYAKAKDVLQKGLMQNPANQTLLELQIQILNATGKNNDSKNYQERLKDLQFEKFQN